MSRLSLFALAAALAVGSLTTVTDAWARGPGGHVSRGPAGHVRSFSAAPRFHAAPRFSAPRFSTAPRFTAAPRGVRTFSGVRNFRAYRGYPRHFGLNRRYRFVGPYAYLGYNSCYRWRQVWTPYGLRLVRVNVCAPYYYPSAYPFMY